MKMHNAKMVLAALMKLDNLLKLNMEVKKAYIRSHIMLLDNLPYIAAGSEILGFPKKYAHLYSNCRF